MNKHSIFYKRKCLKYVEKESVPLIFANVAQVHSFCIFVVSPPRDLENRNKPKLKIRFYV